MSRLLVVEGLFKSYRSGDDTVEVLRDVSLELEEGSMLAVMGESGSGKSTFLHLIGAMERPDRGRIVLEHQELGGLDAEELARFRNRTIGFVFQFHHLLPEFSALENTMFPLLLRGLSFRDAAARAEQLLGDLGLGHRTDHQPGELSGGEQQRVAIARALAGQPRLLLADEPTGNLDEKTSGAIHELLVTIHRQFRLTSIIVTHNPSLAALCNRRCRMADGKLEPLD